MRSRKAGGCELIVTQHVCKFLEVVLMLILNFLTLYGVLL